MFQVLNGFIPFTSILHTHGPQINDWNMASVVTSVRKKDMEKEKKYTMLTAKSETTLYMHKQKISAKRRKTLMIFCT